jgi:ubiquinone/menaquinone biosynthesis C-methylase UbiE
MTALDRLRSEDARDFYGRWVALYDLVARSTPGIGTVRTAAATACRLDPGDTVVEMGCGTGANLPALRAAVGPTGTVVGVDFTRPVLERARARTSGYDNVHVVTGDATCPPVESGVDAVLATFVVGMLDTPGEAVADWCNLVVPGGHVVLVNAASSEAWYAPPVNAIFRALVVLSTPPTARLRYDRDTVARLDDRVNAAHDRLADRAGAIATAHSLFGVVRLLGGRIDHH